MPVYFCDQLTNDVQILLQRKAAFAAFSIGSDYAHCVFVTIYYTQLLQIRKKFCKRFSYYTIDLTDFIQI